jgi:hypothetical protein
MYRGVRDGAKRMQEDDPSQRRQQVAGDHQKQKPGVSDVQVIGSWFSCGKIAMVWWQSFRRPVVDTKHGDAPRWLACGWLRSG